MGSSFIPTGPAQPEDATVANDGWYPDLTVAACRAATGLDGTFSTARVEAEIRAAVIEVGAAITSWRAAQTAASLADVPAPMLGGTSVKVTLYTRAVHCLVRARLVDVTRDYDSTAKGHDRADALEATADAWRQASSEALSRLTGRARTTVELI